MPRQIKALKPDYPSTNINSKAYNGNKKRIIPKITMPIHLYPHTELEEMHKYFTQKNDLVSLAMIEPHLAQRREEAVKVQLMTFEPRQKHEKVYRNTWDQ